MANRDRIDLRGASAEMVATSTRRDTLDLRDVRHLYVVSFASAIPTEDETFFVLRLDDRLWVVPDETEGLQVFLDALVPRLAKAGAVTQRIADNVPLRWRKKVGGFLPLFPLARLDVQPLASLPPPSRWNELALDEERIRQLTWVNYE